MMDTHAQLQRDMHTVLQNTTLMQLAGAPSGSWLDADGLPHITVDGNDLCVVRYCAHGEVFHRCDSHCTGARYRTHILDLTACPPCRVCTPAVPNLHWYNTLLTIVLTLSAYDIPLPHIALTPEDHLTADMVLPMLPDWERYEEPNPWEFNLALPVLQKAIAHQRKVEKLKQ